MRSEILEFLVCPQCREPVDLHPFQESSSEQEGIEEGLLICRGCALPYPVTQGIPRLLINSFHRQGRFRKRFSQNLSRLSFRPVPLADERRFESLHALTARAFGYEWN